MTRGARATFGAAIGLVLAGAGWRRPARAADPEPPPAPAWHATALLGTTAVAANNVLPVPMAIGGGALIERGWIGIEGAVYVDAATLCDHGTAGDSGCGLLWIFDVAPHATLAPGASWSPYLCARFQITRSDPHGVVPALGPRAGLRYRGSSLGFFLEGGPSFVSSREGETGGFASGRDWFPQLSTGMTFALR
jgi:hypothetical protein